MSNTIVSTNVDGHSKTAFHLLLLPIRKTIARQHNFILNFYITKEQMTPLTTCMSFVT